MPSRRGPTPSWPPRGLRPAAPLRAGRPAPLAPRSALGHHGTPELTTLLFVVTSDTVLPPKVVLWPMALRDAVGRFMRRQPIASGDHSQLSARYSSREMPSASSS